ncbi:MAG TPA: hypothetical protein VG755_32040 [Nannocystaceae bacterium]|nr:hypothetical protein [Nannocystaceae bacterium]
MSEVDVVAAVVATRRLARGGGPRHSFTVERSEARLKLRDRPGQRPWEWTLVLVRGLLALVDVVDIEGTSSSSDGVETLELTMRVDETALAGFDPGIVFDAALEPDPGPSDGSLTHRQLRLRRLLARAINECLARGPRSVELVTPVGTRTIARHDRPGADPYTESSTPGTSAANTLRLRVAFERGFSRWLDGLLSGGEGMFGGIAAEWNSRVASMERRRGGAIVHATPQGPFVALGRHARLWPAAARGSVQLLRDGVAVLALDDVLGTAGISVLDLAGAIECPRLRLTVDETNVVRDEALDLLIAWLRDAIARGEGKPLQTVKWPETIAMVSSAVGAEIAVEALGEGAREIPWVRPEQRDALPLAARAHVLVLSPSELEVLQRQRPELGLVPAQAIVGVGQGDPANLTALAQGCLAPLPLTVPHYTDGGEALAIEVLAFVHKHPVAARGAVMLIARERMVARTELDAALPGVTLVAKLPVSTEAAAIVAASDRQQALARWIAAQGVTQRDALLAHAVASLVDAGAGERMPLLRGAIDRLDARALQLRYHAEQDGSARLVWREHPLLGLVVATTRDNAARTLGAALVRARDVGGIVIGEHARRWYVLETSDADHETWLPSARGHELLVRILGTGALWELPTVPQIRAHVAPAERQRALMLDRGEVARQLARTSTDPDARDALLAHLLVARAVGGDELGLRDVPLCSTFDPDAVQPSRIVSLALVLADDRMHAVVPTGTATRELAGPVVEAPPGIAALLHEVVQLPLAAIQAPRRRAVATATRSAAARVSVEPVLRHPITDALAAGALHLLPDGDRNGVDLWARGLRIGELELPSPLAQLGGRLWLSDAGVRAGRPAIEVMLLKHARALVLAARRQAALAPPGGQRRRALERFVGHCEAVASAGDDRLGLRALFASAPRSSVLSANAATAARLPSLRRAWLGALVKHAVGHAAKTSTGWLTWKLARIAEPASPVWQIELGGRHRWIARAERDDASVLDVQLAALAVAAEVLASAQAPRAAIAAAMLRVLATAHVGPRT